ncbi:MAG: ComEC/Rec2 family competence protein [Pseudomonadota bacterium]
MPFLTRIKTSFFNDQDCWILWLPVFFGAGIIFYFYFPNNSYLFPLALFLSAISLIIIFQEQLKNLLFIALATFLIGFLWTKFYTEKIAYTPKIEYKFYATAIGLVDDINSFYNPILKRNSAQIVLKDLALYKAGSVSDDVIIKKEKPKKVKKKKPKKPRKKRKKKISNDVILSEAKDLANQQEILRFAQDDKIKQDDNIEQDDKIKKEPRKKIKKPKPKKSKKENKTVIKSYLNVVGYQEIDREFLSIDYKSQNQNWLGNRYIKAPQKVLLSVNTQMSDVKIGDIIQTRVVLEPFKPPYFPGGYDKGFENYFKGIGGEGYAASNLKVLKARNENSFFQDIKILRQNIARKILDQMDEQGGTMAVALLVGAQNLIKPDVMQAMRNSGLAHLISISGLHFTLAAGIFFFSVRFLLSLNQYLTLNYDIKKISALIAIFAGFFYLLLADMPVPAVRSFIIIALIFSAILLDLKPDAFRSTTFAALAILIFSPNAIFSVSFQLSFAAILALIVLADLSKPIHINSSSRPVYLKFFFYFLGIVLSSLAATLATTPFSIYHFNNFISYGALANLAAIPIASFITMPCGFLALLLMPFGIEKFALYPMQISIHWIIDIAGYVAAMPNSYLTIKAISPLSFGIIIFGGLWLMLWKKTWRLLGLIPISLGIYLAYQTPIPNLLIDQNKKMVAFYDHKKLIFLKPTKSKQAMVWAKKLGLNEFKNIDDLNEEEKQNLQMNCEQNFCEFLLQEKRILVLSGRNKIDEVCQNDYDIVVNISKKYQLPKCFLNTKTLIDNGDSKETNLIFIQPQSR